METSSNLLASINTIEPRKFISQLSKQLERTSRSVINKPPSLSCLPENSIIYGTSNLKNTNTNKATLLRVDCETDLPYKKIENSRPENLSIFKHIETPSISLPCFIQRFYTYGGFTYQHILAGLVLVSRFIAILGEKSENLCLFKIFGASLFLAHKFIDEYEMWSAKDYGLICGSSASTVLKMEELLCSVLDFKVFITQEEIVGMAKLVFTSLDEQIIRNEDGCEVEQANNYE